MRPKKTILCVDDNEQSLSIRKVMLETRGYRVLTAASAREAMLAFHKGGIDLELNDLIMLDCDGRQLIEQIKAVSPQTLANLYSIMIPIFTHDEMPINVLLLKGIY